MRNHLLLPLLGLCALGILPAQATGLTERDDVRAFIDRVTTTHQLDRDALTQLLEEVEIRQDILDSMIKPAERKPWWQYRPIFITDARIAEGVAFMREHAATLQRAEDNYGVPASIIAGIIGVETRFGRHTGRYRVLDALATLGFDYPPRQAFFIKELEELLLLAREEALDPRTTLGSYAGAMGLPQFMPSSYRKYAVDFDGDGKRDLLGNVDDVIGSVANYLASHGWQRGQPVTIRANSTNPGISGNGLKPQTTVAQWREQGINPTADMADNLPTALIILENEADKEFWLGLNNFYAITRYNISAHYAMAVFQLGEAMRTALASPAPEATAQAAPEAVIPAPAPGSSAAAAADPVTTTATPPRDPAIDRTLDIWKWQ